MGEDNKDRLPKEILRAFAPLHRGAMGVAWGVVLGCGIFLLTAVLLVKGPQGNHSVGPNLALLAQFFFGYTVTWPGAFIGLLWGLVVGFVLGWGFAFTRNLVFWLWLTLVRSRAEMEQYDDFLDHM
jgi:hypothetical protein